ncbi:unnamed protein product [Commensalibacter communis]|uniref:Phage protein Gp138 N-terminal domain-containing protein n=1 Tax=Commensalibacter communis TaxID=2972786 RepID=A0A9W4XIR0_9PROT|nr:Gp138 family membrane-puncturing spike protein [Commensalibacter communis]CAI3956710.1 unnamed protein product [Commensalibacter communis]CAI3958045.1 unnamed protein product [Commensalibacter communis]CAI3959642.1 unnamed protein product [Commensalibacter communis]CAI3959749.1 unnamed protein product [Commensalibacter communis]
MINPNKGNSSLNTLVGIIDNALSSVSTAMPVTVLQVYPNHTLDVMPMVDMLDNEGNAVEHAPIIGIPYARLQGGDYGLIVEPKVGDKGLVVFASRDISDVVQSKEKTKPASLRKHSMSDGMYIASLLYEEPKTYIKIEKENITIHTKNLLVEDNDNTTLQAKKILVDNNEETTINCIGTVSINGQNISLKAPNVNILGNVNIVGNLDVAGSAKISTEATIKDIAFTTHVHGNGNNGSPTSGPQ